MQKDSWGRKKNDGRCCDEFEGISEKTSVPSEKTSDKILAIIGLDMKTTARHMVNVLGLSSRAVEMQLAKLKHDGRLKRVGPKKGGNWEVRRD